MEENRLAIHIYNDKDPARGEKKEVRKTAEVRGKRRELSNLTKVRNNANQCGREKLQIQLQLHFTTKSRKEKKKDFIKFHNDEIQSIFDSQLKE